MWGIDGSFQSPPSVALPLTVNSMAGEKFPPYIRAMMIVPSRADRRRWVALRAVALCALSVPFVGSAAAGDASRWDGDARSAIRLIAGSARPGDPAPLRAGIEIRLQPGWHTYWRYPGDAGVPPRFDFSGSQNVKTVDVRWPAPDRIPEATLTVVGYTTGPVILPLAVVPENRGKPVTLRLKLDYAVCEKLCVPVEGKAELVLAGGSSSENAALVAAEARVPKRVSLGEGSPLAVKSVRREGAPARIVVDVAAPAGANVALFAEGPAPDWALPVPSPIEGAPPGLHRFAFDLDGAPPGAKYEGAVITLTARAGEAAIEVATRLD
jgi:DsbC/DsbD-like thiol-disulfide interchange protein